VHRNRAAKTPTGSGLVLAWCGWSLFSALPEERVGAFPVVPTRTAGTMPMLPVHPWSALSFIPGIERSGIVRRDRRDASAVENSVMNGGSLTPRKPNRPNQRD
jgi:hypothetical protein